MLPTKNFASDNNAGVHPKILNAIQEANIGHAVAYGDDIYTKSAIQNLKEIFGKDIDAYFVFNGTAANVLALQTITHSYHSIICSQSAHINVDECGAPEKFTGCKLITVETEDGKITVEKIRPHLHSSGDPTDNHDQHHNQPKVIVLSQTTEMGTVYQPEEIKEITAFAKQHQMFVFMDGARLSNAAASLGKSLKEITSDAGIDVITFGGTKNGLMMGEAIIFFNPELSKAFKYIRKQGMQLASKMRFISAQFSEYLKDELWLRNATHANQMARLLADKLENVPQISLTRKVEANAVFATLSKKHILLIQQKCFFYIWNEEKGEVRWMTSFDTTEADIDNFVNVIKEIVTTN